MIKNIDRNRFNIRNPPLPAKKNPFHLGKTNSDTTENIAIIAIIIHITVNIVFFCVIVSHFFTKIIKNIQPSSIFYPIRGKYFSIMMIRLVV